MARLRLTTEGRFFLTGWTPEQKAILQAHKTWMLNGRFDRAQVLLVPAAPCQTGYSVMQDGRIYIANGQAGYEAYEEMELDVVVVPAVVNQSPPSLLLHVVTRSAPSDEKLAHMIARPTKAPTEKKPDPLQPTLF